MLKREIDLREQRELLLARIALERRLLARVTTPVAQALDVKSRMGGLVEQAKLFAMQNPLAIAGVAGALLIFKPRMLVRLAQRGLVFWKTWRSVRGLLPPSLLGRFFGNQRTQR